MRGDIFLLQEVHLRDEEDAAAFTLVEWWEAANCWQYAVAARQRDRAGVAKWTASLAFGICISPRTLQPREPVDWAIYEGTKERLRGLLEARAKVLAFQARLHDLEEGERPTAYFFKAFRACRGVFLLLETHPPPGHVGLGRGMQSAFGRGQH
ncbi:hypothetical protein AAFF_G00097960 [Aldrovandia affinis]|uniref:Uncharacterized protein n=1 Tax=Aldrovandia affinis TaxID=143900 RepID=A0AAD7WBW4_9TELE|nr:hypothetical protein AAFF_G00097960 [Aldrovandia affinis]